MKNLKKVLQKIGVGVLMALPVIVRLMSSGGIDPPIG